MAGWGSAGQPNGCWGGAGLPAMQQAAPSTNIPAAFQAKVAVPEETAVKRLRLSVPSAGSGLGAAAGMGGCGQWGGACGSCSGCGSAAVNHSASSSSSGALGSGSGCGGCSGLGSVAGCGGCALNPMQMAQMMQMQALVQMQIASEAGASAQEQQEEAPADPKEFRYLGVIRDYNESQGFGFIECEDAKLRFGMDVFIHRRQMFGLHKGDEVSFVIIRNSQGQPQARHVIKKEETDKILAKRKEREKREAQKLQAKKQGGERVFTPSTMEGRVMTEKEALEFQASLKRKR
eukprot:gb/GFBE01021500.1/.p1 GENE.gb/GFBE01021500.1/~~gb/GFBE01021500.1/.p1  ORF type:complete len:290 (+),score=76.20 gb/GFBE01021500.1/:1-870(+)